MPLNLSKGNPNSIKSKMAHWIPIVIVVCGDVNTSVYEEVKGSSWYFIVMWVSWKVHRSTKILSWNLTKLGLFFKIVPLVVYTFIPSHLISWTCGIPWLHLNWGVRHSMKSPVGCGWQPVMLEDKIMLTEQYKVVMWLATLHFGSYWARQICQS